MAMKSCSAFPTLLWTLLLAAWAGRPCTTLAEDRAAWMRKARWGVMTHYLADWRARVDKTEMSVETWNELVDHFDVEGLAEQLKSVGAGYHILTIGQNSGYYACPNPTYDRLTGIQPSKCSRRDLIGDMARTLQKRGISLIAYLPSGAPGQDAAARTALRAEGAGRRNRDFQLKWEQVIFQRVLGRVDRKEVERIAPQWQNDVLGPLPPNEAVVLDGKAARAAGAMLVGASAQPSQRALGVEPVDSKTNEIPAARQLIARLDLAGRLGTHLDAPLCPAALDSFLFCPRGFRLHLGQPR
jgi:hypothetical protein